MSMLRPYCAVALLCIFTLGCAAESSPVQVHGRLSFGPYEISPPEGYWFFPRQYPDNIKTAKHGFLVTFWECKDTIPKIGVEKTNPGVFSNFGVSANTYNSVADYYSDAATHGIQYQELPMEAEEIKLISDWSCKYEGGDVDGIECISLRGNMITIGAYGRSKDEVLAKVTVLKGLLESFHVVGSER